MSEGGEPLVEGRYRLKSRIGSGAMGIVWRAVDERLDRTVAVKQLLLPPGLNEVETEKARQRAFREGRIAARLQHPHAISVYNVAEHDGHPVLVMEYLPSRSLSAVLEERGTLPPVEIARIGAQVATALAAAHAAGVIHRDVKPGNILLGEDGTAKITDFGISRAAGDVTVTSTGLLAGTPAFLSPEAARGADPGPASDVFSLAATLYAAVEGRPPFDSADGNEIAMLHAVATGRVVPPRQAGPLTAPLGWMLNSEPTARPTMAQVEQALRAVADGHNPPSPPSGAQPQGHQPHNPQGPSPQVQNPQPQVQQPQVQPIAQPVATEPPTMPASPMPPSQGPVPANAQAAHRPGSTRLDLRPGPLAPPPPSMAPAMAPAPRPGAPAAGAPSGGNSRARLAVAALAVLAAVAVGILVAELLFVPGQSDGDADSGSPATTTATTATANLG
ncbi:serine/threonine protein kinase [Saccharomonospora marina XMU15]|uniref:non-specific serine/threonine protein kinase n=1 Tax=Saccharomonospora marina XMU15 TaxID=882083 RepID=H5X8R9_9PSEU|nr:serine/threonine protein kinase [Saccharomonospora marina XMU15]